MNWQVKCGDIVDESADVLICSANINLNLSGGVGGELLMRYGMDLQEELHRALADRAGHFACQGEVFETRLASMPYLAVLHAVAVDAMYQTGPEVVSRLVSQCLQRARELGARTVALAALGTGFGTLTLTGFAEALTNGPARAATDLEAVIICLPEEDRAQELGEEMRALGML